MNFSCKLLPLAAFGCSFFGMASLLRAQTSEPLAEAPAGSVAVAEAQSKATAFLRLQRVAGQPRSLDTAVASYRREGGEPAQVDLIGAVHIGEASYYSALNELFDSYDVLLYELVAPEGTVIPPGGRRDGPRHPVSMLQDGAKSMLGLESQLACVDYSKSHFVRADLTPQQMAEKMSQRGENVLSLTLSTLADMVRQQNAAQRDDQTPATLAEEPAAKIEELSLVDLMSNPLKLKRVFAEQFAATGALDQALGERLNQLLIVDRNEAAIQVLQQQLAQGHKKIGIFYGAAHLPDLERRLIDELGMRPIQDATHPRWLVAWDLTQATPPQLSKPANLFLQLLKTLE